MKNILNKFEDYEFKSNNFEDKKEEFMSKDYLTKVITVDISFIVNDLDYTIKTFYNNIGKLMEKYGEDAEIFFDKYHNDVHYESILEFRRLETEDEYNKRMIYINELINKDKEIKERNKISKEIKEKKLLEKLAKKYKIKLIE